MTVLIEATKTVPSAPIEGPPLWPTDGTTQRRSAGGGQRVHVAGRARDDDSTVGADSRRMQDVLAADLKAPLDDTLGCGGRGSRTRNTRAGCDQQRERTDEDCGEAYHPCHTTTLLWTSASHQPFRTYYHLHVSLLVLV